MFALSEEMAWRKAMSRIKCTDLPHLILLAQKAYQLFALVFTELRTPLANFDGTDAKGLYEVLINYMCVSSLGSNKSFLNFNSFESTHVCVLGL